ncbi:hypothetical protein ACN27G_20890 [Plantactinospora sp. WMMB334]|uniref:hypothetical protein n=1 Tax=Plantactinospora sp. WMMB334 TaxID=3404119 RepID=UPI003B938A8F
MPDRPRERLLLGHGRPALLGAAVVAGAGAVAFLLAAPMGTDLAAQVARAGFVDRYGMMPVDLGWYGGVHQFGYSLFSAALGAAVGVRTVGAVAAVGAAVTFAWLLVRGNARRPLLGAVLGALVLLGNLVSGRITFALGLALALAALSTAAAGRLRPAARLGGAGLLAALATWASPVAGLFTGLAGAALLLAHLVPAPDGPGDGLGRAHRTRRYRAEGVVLAAAPAAALAPMALLFGNGGVQPFTAESMRINVALAVLTVVIVPAGHRVLRYAAGLTVLLLLLAYHLPSPVGSNALRLTMLFTVPVLAAYAELDRRRLAALLAAVVWWQPPVMTGDLGRAGSGPTRADFYRPLADELDRRARADGPIGRIEVAPLRDHWESAHLARRFPLARGWERQVDVARNPLFYDSDLTTESYRDWLHHNAVSFVAVAPESPPDRYAREETALVAAGLPYLTEVWRDPTWRLYAVTDPTPLVEAPGRLIGSTPAEVRFRTEAAGELLIRVSWSRWLVLDGPTGCLRPTTDGWTEVRVAAAGEYRLTSGWQPGPAC